MKMELTINNEVYGFKFGFGWMREVNSLFKRPMEGFKGKEERVGMQYVIAYIVDGDPEYLITALDLANKGQTPRITRQTLEEYIESDECDIDALFEQVIDFLQSANVSKKVTKAIVEAAAKAKAEAAAEN